MNKYNSYKNSDIQWIEKIPISWDTKKLKFLGTVYGGLTGKKGDDFGDEDNPKNKPYIPYTNIFNNSFISKDHFDFVILEKDEKQNLVKKNDLFILMSSENFEDLGKTSILVDDCEELYLNSFCKGFRITNENMNPIFINYQLQGHLHRELISVEGSGFTRINLQQNRLLNTPILITSLKEQNQIVSFLDTKTSLIDSLIEKTQRKVELLKEQRISLINEVVTKGLNPNVEMKNSGIEWIGEIPSHWDVMKLKYLSRITPSSVDKHIFDDEIQVSVCNYTHVYYNNFINTKVSLDVGSCTENEFSKFKLYKDDVIITKDSESQDDIGIPTLVSESLENTVCGYHLTIIRPEGIKGGYLFRFILSERSRRYFEINSNGVTRFGLGKPSVENLEIPLPSEEEQEQIITYLNQETQIIDDLISNEQKRIDLLKEYKQSIISEVVTGKKRVV